MPVESSPAAAGASENSFEPLGGVGAPGLRLPGTTSAAHAHAAAAPRGGLDLVSASQAKQETERRCSWEESDVQLGKDTKKTNPSCGNYKP